MKVRSARQASYGSTLIETFFKSVAGSMVPIGYATGFRTRFGDRDFLGTNWHVVTNRNPNNPSQTLSHGESPTHILLHLPRSRNAKHFVPTGLFSLYGDDGKPQWLESSKGFEWADIVLLPGQFPSDAVFAGVEDFAPSRGTIVEAGLDVCLVGFPFGRNQTNPFPIWKKAMVASEPAYAIDGKPFAYLDTPGRPGMSGSPVYAISDAIMVSPEVHEALDRANAGERSALHAIQSVDVSELSKPGNRTRGLEFVGVYSGTLGDSSLDRLNLGRFWPAWVLDDIEHDCRRGTNPVPPILY